MLLINHVIDWLDSGIKKIVKITLYIVRINYNGIQENLRTLRLLSYSQLGLVLIGTLQILCLVIDSPTPHGLQARSRLAQCYYEKYKRKLTGPG